MKERPKYSLQNKPLVIIEEKLNLVYTELTNGVLNFIYEIDKTEWHSLELLFIVAEVTNNIIKTLPNKHEIFVYLGYKIKIVDKEGNLLDVLEKCRPTCTLPN